MICEYGCGREATFKPRKGQKKWCCEEYYQRCPGVKKLPWNKGKVGVYSKETLDKMKESSGKNKGKTWEDIFGEKRSNQLKKESSERMVLYNKNNSPWNKGKVGCFSDKTRKVMSDKAKERMEDEFLRYSISLSLKRNIDYYKINYPFFYKIEKPIQDSNGNIKVRCKRCEQFFEPSGNQLYERVRQLEKDYGNGGSYFYCSDECKYTCPLWNLKGDPNWGNSKFYTQKEYQTFRQFVLKRDNYKCQFCGEKATDVHHERPQKLEPFFALDPDFAWSCCKKCHYEKGHPTSTECSTGNLSSKMCF